MSPATLLLVLFTGCAPSIEEQPVPLPVPAQDLGVPPVVGWPMEGSDLVVLQPAMGAPPALRVSLDPGHGVGRNSGNFSSLCIDEQDHNLRIAHHLAASLQGAGFEAPRLSRIDNRGPAYSTRIRDAGSWDADLLLSLHSDVRGHGREWSPEPGCSAWWNDANPGFSVLWSDEGEPELAAARLELARAISARLAEAGFLPHDGYEYQGIYEGDPDHPGVFVDRHEPRRRIRMLRRPPMPSVIIETHNAWDRREESRWQQEETLEAFDAAVVAALGDLAEPGAASLAP